LEIGIVGNGNERIIITPVNIHGLVLGFASYHYQLVFIMQGEASMKVPFHVLHQSVHCQWMLDEVIDVNDIFICLEPLLSRVDILRWLSLLALYPLFPQLSSKQRNLALLTQADIGDLVQSLQNPHSIHSAVELMSCAVSSVHNVKVLLENGIVELLAELLEDQCICQGDMNSIVMLIEKIATADVTGVNLQEQPSVIEDQVETTSETVFFIQQLRGKLIFFHATQDWKLVPENLLHYIYNTEPPIYTSLPV
jgi:hypothetical protein